jgi:hypothetical protein
VEGTALRLLALIERLLTVVAAAGLTVTESGLVASEATATASIILMKVGLGGRLLGSITLAMSGRRPVYSPRRGFWLSVGVQFRVIAKKLVEVLGPDVRHDAWFYEGPSGGRLSITAAIR